MYTTYFVILDIVLRNAIAEAMVWCIEHADSGEEIVDCLAESLSILEVSTRHWIHNMMLSTKSMTISHTSTCFRPQQLKR